MNVLGYLQVYNENGQWVRERPVTEILDLEMHPDYVTLFGPNLRQSLPRVDLSDPKVFRK